MRGDYSTDRTWSDERLDTVKDIIGKHILDIGDEIQDMQKMGDLPWRDWNDVMGDVRGKFERDCNG